MIEDHGHEAARGAGRGVAAAPPLRRRILHVAQPDHGGVATCVLALARHQASAGHDVGVACPPGGPLAHRLDDRVRFLEWPAARSPGLQSLSETRRLRAIVRAVEPDIVHLHSAKAGLAGRVALRGSVLTVFQPHGWSFHAASGAMKRAVVAWERYASRWAHSVVCVSEGERATGVRMGIDARWRVVPNGADIKHFRPPTAAERSSSRRRLRLPADVTVAVCVGRESEAKGQDQLLALWPLVATRLPNARLLLVGHGVERLHRMAQSEDVILLDAVEDVRPLLHAADLLVAPSRWEGASLAVIEGMACGLPVVMTDVSGAREVVAAAGGSVVPVGDMAAFAAAMTALLVDETERSTQARSARAYVAEHFALPHTLAIFDRLYGDLSPTGAS